MSYLEREKLEQENKDLKEQITDWASVIQSVSDDMPRGCRDITLKEIAKDMKEAGK